MPMTGFFCQDAYLEKTAKLSDQEVGRLFRALMTYHATGEAAELKGREEIAFDFIRDDIDRDEAKYAAKCEQARQNRAKAGNTGTGVDGGQRRSTETDGGYKSNRKEIYEKETPLTGRKEKPRSRFSPPKVEEVAEYCRERGNNVDPELFWSFYESKGWKVGNQAMKDWKAAVITWEKEDRKREIRGVRVISAQEYKQRDYSGVDERIRAEQDREMHAFLEGSG